jgi:hypothetical protein
MDRTSYPSVGKLPCGVHADGVVIGITKQGWLMGHRQGYHRNEKSSQNIDFNNPNYEVFDLIFNFIPILKKPEILSFHFFIIYGWNVQLEYIIYKIH